MIAMTTNRLGWCQCGCGQRTTLAQRNDPSKGQVAGQPNRFVLYHYGRSGLATRHLLGARRRATPRPRRSIADRFWSKVNKTAPGGCWLWTGAKTQSGYGSFGCQSDARRNIRAHRLAWELFYSRIPNGLLVLHTCDVRHCVNPRHLFLSTTQENTADMVDKGRNATKLTAPQVRVIRRLHTQGVSRRQLARTYCVDRRTIRDLLARVTWRYLH